MRIQQHSVQARGSGAEHVDGMEVADVQHALGLRADGLRLVVVSNSNGTVEEGLTAIGLRALLDGVVDSAVPLELLTTTNRSPSARSARRASGTPGRTCDHSRCVGTSRLSRATRRCARAAASGPSWRRRASIRVT